MTYNELLIEADSNGLIVKEKDLPISNGRIKGNRIALKKDLSETEKKCILAEELGHYYTTVGNILDQTEVSNRKQEQRARMWAYDRMVGLLGLIDCFKAGCRNRYEAAEYLEVTEEFLQQSIEAYHRRYGKCTQMGDYGIYFEPALVVIEII